MVIGLTHTYARTPHTRATRTHHTYTHTPRAQTRTYVCHSFICTSERTGTCVCAHTKARWGRSSTRKKEREKERERKKGGIRCGCVRTRTRVYSRAKYGRLFLELSFLRSAPVCRLLLRNSRSRARSYVCACAMIRHTTLRSRTYGVHTRVHTTRA